MYKIFLLVTTITLCNTATELGFCQSFQRRFGPNSPIYNEHLYFSKGHLSHRARRSVKPKHKQKQYGYREQIRKHIKNKEASQKTPQCQNQTESI